MYWEDLTTVEFQSVDRRTPVILSVSAIEQHGPHLPVEVDAAIGAFFLKRLNDTISERILILPQMKVCCSSHHMSFPGTLSVSHETFLAYGFEILSSAAAHGFQNFLVLNSHGGNQAVGRVLVEKFGIAFPDCRAAFFTWWTMVGKELSAVKESGPFGVGHGCEFETSLMMAAQPAAVRGDRIQGLNFIPTFDWANGDMLSPSRGYLFRPIKDASGGTGVLGDPSKASADKGEAIAGIVVGQLKAVVDSLFVREDPK